MTRRSKQEWAIAAGLAVIALASRIPLRSRYLANWDAGNFALALDDYDLAHHQPQPPGYILYIALGRLFKLLTGDANSALVAISIIASAAAVVGIYVLGRDIFNRRAGLAAATLLLFSPLAWYYGEVALSYGPELPLVIALIWLLYQLLFHRRFLFSTSVVLGIAGGFRQDVLVFMGLFWLAGSLRMGIRPFVKSGLLLAVTVLAWLTPLVMAAGGWAAFRFVSKAQFETGVLPTSVFELGWSRALELSSVEVWRALLWLLGAAVPALILAVVLMARPRLFWARRQVQLLAAMMVLPLLFFWTIHLGQPGYLLVYSAPLFLLIAGALDRLITLIPERPGPSRVNRFLVAGLMTGVLMIIAITNTALFARAARMDVKVKTAKGTIAQVFGPYSASGIRESDRQMEATLDSIRKLPADSFEVVSFYPYIEPYTPDWRQLMYYLPEYRVIRLKMDIPGGDYLAGEGRWHVYFEGWDVTVEPDTRGLVFVGLDPTWSFVTHRRVPGDESRAPVTSAELPPEGEIRIGGYTFRH